MCAKDFQVLKNIYLILILIMVSACGVKGPPEPPLPNEASISKSTKETSQGALTEKQESEQQQQTEKPIGSEKTALQKDKNKKKEKK